MKVAPRGIERFLGAPPETVRVILLYGPDSGLVRERAGRTVAAVVDDPADPFRVAELGVAELRDDPARLADEAASMSLTGGRRLVHVRDAGDWLADALGAFLAAPQGDALIVIEAGPLAPRSRLRAVAERAEQAAAVPCYTDDNATLEQVIRDTLGQHGLRASPDAMAYLVANLGGDRLVSRSELDKLCLFMGDNAGEITLSDAAACVGDSAAMTLDDIAFAVAGGDLAGVVRLLDRAHQEGAGAVAMVRAVARHFMRLHYVAGLIAGGRPRDAAMKSLRPPVFFKQADLFGTQLRHWPVVALGDALDALGEAEIGCKTTGLPSDALCDQALLRLATTGRRLATARR